MNHTRFFVTGGTLRPDALCYVERQADRDLYQGLLNGEFCYVLTPRQMGKSSLMVRSVVRLRNAGVQVAVLDLTSIGQNLTPEQWYDGLISRLGQQLGVEDPLLEFWRSHAQWGPLQRWISAVEWLLKSEDRIVIFIDEIDTVRSLPFSTDEFFAGIRECYNRRARDSRFDRLTFGLLGVATPTDLIRDPRLTPFNIGRRVEVHDFTESESLPLAQGLSANPITGQTLLRRVLYWTGGQPFLTQRLCQAVVETLQRTSHSDATPAPRNVPPTLPTAACVDDACSRLFLESSARERDDNLIFVRERILRSDADLTALLGLYRAIRRGRRVPDNDHDPLISTLKLSGLTCNLDGVLGVRNRIYQAVFDEKWIANNMPEAEMRRQRKAFRRGIFLAFATMICLLAGALALFVNSLRLNPLGLTTTMPDGTVITLDTVTYGREHHYEPGHFRTAWLPHPFGDSAQSPRKPSFDLVTESDALTFWMTRRDAKSGVYLNFDWWSHFELVDSHGCVFFGNLRAVRHDRNAAGGFDSSNLAPLAPADATFIIASGATVSFPRRERLIELRLYDLAHNMVGKFSIPNPVYRNYPVWRAEPLPQTRREQDLAITLSDIQTRLVPYRWLQASVDLPITSITWQAFYNGSISTQWEAASWTIGDATGNEQPLKPALPSPGLCPREDAWAVRGVLYQTAAAAAEEPSGAWALGDLAVPEYGQIQTHLQKRYVNDINVQFHGLVGPGRFRIDQESVVPYGASSVGRDLIGDGWFLFTRTEGPLARYNPTVIATGRPFLVFHVDRDEATPLRLALAATDAEGRSLEADQYRHGNFYFLALPPESLQLRNVRIWFRVPRQIEFLVRPPTPAKSLDDREHPASSESPLQPFPPRDPLTPPNLIDLAAHYNASLNEDWHGQISGNDLARLPQGVVRLGDVDFDIRGIVQVAGNEGPAQRFPRQIQGIRVDQHCRQLHFLHGSGWNATRGAFIGQYIVRYEDDTVEVIPLTFGRNIEDWWFAPQDPAKVSEADVVWTGANRASLSLDRGTRLYKYSWTNPHPALRVKSIDFLSGMTDSAPFLIAITAE
jgi:hypothetical protein